MANRRILIPGSFESMTDAHLRDSIKDCRVALEEMEGVLAVRAEMSEDRRLASDLHRIKCDHRECSWSYESTWDGSDHQRYLAKAQEMLQLTDAATAIRIAEISRSA